MTMGTPANVPVPGDYACRMIGGETGKLITLGEKLNGDSFTQYDHAEIFVGMADLQAPYGYVMGAQPGGARLDPLPADHITGYAWSSGKIPMTSAERAEIISMALACKGVPYSAADYFALAAHRLHIPAPGLREYIGSHKQMICSQLVDYCYMRAGVHLFADGRWPGYVTPADLAGVIK